MPGRTLTTDRWPPITNPYSLATDHFNYIGGIPLQASCTLAAPLSAVCSEKGLVPELDDKNGASAAAAEFMPL